jgi:hypothetical protein
MSKGKRSGRLDALALALERHPRGLPEARLAAVAGIGPAEVAGIGPAEVAGLLERDPRFARRLPAREPGNPGTRVWVLADRGEPRA